MNTASVEGGKNTTIVPNDYDATINADDPTVLLDSSLNPKKKKARKETLLSTSDPFQRDEILIAIVKNKVDETNENSGFDESGFSFNSEFVLCLAQVTARLGPHQGAKVLWS